MVSAGTHIKCAAGTLRAYLRRRTDDALASFVSSRSLSVRGSWGAAPSVFWHGAPGGSQGPPGKGGAAERWRVVYPIGIATRHGAKPATTRTHKRNAPAASRTGFAPCIFSATPTGDLKFGLKTLLLPFAGAKGRPRRRAVQAVTLRRLRDAEGEMKLWHNLCHQSLRLISFATSLCTREAFAARRLPTWSRISSAAHSSANRSPAPARRDPSPPQIIIINPSKLFPYKSTSYVNSTQHFPIL